MEEFSCIKVKKANALQQQQETANKARAQAALPAKLILIYKYHLQQRFVTSLSTTATYQTQLASYTTPY